jgi:hypothetical protein
MKHQIERGRRRIDVSEKLPEELRGALTNDKYKQAVEEAAARTARTPKNLRPAVKEHASLKAARDPRLSRADLAVLTDILSRVHWKDGLAISTLQKTAERTGLTLRTVNRRFKRLAFCGHIARWTERKSNSDHRPGKIALPHLNGEAWREHAEQKRDWGNGLLVTRGSDKQTTRDSDTVVPLSFVRSPYVISPCEEAREEKRLMGEAQQAATAASTNNRAQLAGRARRPPSKSPLNDPAQQPPLSLRPSAKTIDDVRRHAIALSYDSDTAVTSTWALYNIGDIGHGKAPDERFFACWNAQLTGAARQRPAAGFRSLGFSASRALDRIA